MSVTVKDIADKANVSTATVSRALNPEQTGIKPEVRNMIVELAQKMGYQKKGRSKANSSTNGYVGIIYKRAPTSFYNDGVLGDRLYHAIEVALYKENKQVLMHNLALNDAAPAFLQDGLVSGVLLVELDISNEHQLLSELVEHKIPAVAINHPGNLNDFDVVSMDYIQCFESLTNRLINKGCKKVAFVSDSYGHYVSRNGFLGYSLALLENGLTHEDAIWIKEEDSSEIGRQAAKQIAADGSIDGVICMTNMIAANLIDELQALGKKVPADVKVCGFDPSDTRAKAIIESTNLKTAITCGIYNLNDMTDKAVERLQYRSENPLGSPARILNHCDIQDGETD